MEPPYTVPHPKELTHRLHTNWLHLKAQNRRSSHSLEPAQVKQHMQSTHNNRYFTKMPSDTQKVMLVFKAALAVHTT
jgi:hypothetical protein